MYPDLMPKSTGVASRQAFFYNVYHSEISRVQYGKFYFPIMHHLTGNYQRLEACLEGTMVHSQTALMNISGGKVH